MATEVNIFDQTYPSFGDLRSNQFYFAEFQAANIVQKCSATTAVACGIIQNNPNSGQPCVIRHIGKSKLVFGSSVTAGQLVSPTNVGTGKRVIPGTDTTNYITAEAVESAVSGDVRSVIIRGTPVRGA